MRRSAGCITGLSRIRLLRVLDGLIGLGSARVQPRGADRTCNGFVVRRDLKDNGAPFAALMGRVRRQLPIFVENPI
jgi:hypothetical protein